VARIYRYNEALKEVESGKGRSAFTKEGAGDFLRKF